MENNYINKSDDKIYRVSWLGYIRPVLMLLVVTVICSAIVIARSYGTPAIQLQLANSLFVIVPSCIIVLAIISFALRLYYLRTLRFIVNADGVYLFRGIFPWTKGTTGTLWQDIADAQYFPGFIAWITKTYSIQVRFRFDKSNETFVPYIWNGNQAVITINQTLQERARASQDRRE